jgi:hypothetical protein
MMRNLSLIYFIFLFIFPEALLAQVAQEKPKKIELNGYVSNMQSVSLEDLQGTWISDNLFHNRLNLFWYPNSNLSGSLQLRNRFMYGQSLQLNPEYASSVDEDNGLIDLSMNIFNEQSFFFNTAIDQSLSAILKR